MNRPLRRLEAEVTGERQRQMRAIALMCGACAVFSCLDATAKYLVQSMDALQIVWARYTSAFVLAFLVSNPLTRPGLLSTRRPRLQIGRSGLLLASTADGGLQAGVKQRPTRPASSQLGENAGNRPQVTRPGVICPGLRFVRMVGWTPCQHQPRS